MWKCDVEFTDFEKRLRPDSQMSFCFKGIEYYISDMRNQAFLCNFFCKTPASRRRYTSAVFARLVNKKLFVLLAS